MSEKIYKWELSGWGTQPVKIEVLKESALKRAERSVESLKSNLEIAEKRLEKIKAMKNPEEEE